jgi:hypothetical protein
MPRDIVKRQPAFAFGRRSPPGRDQARQPAIRRSIRRPQQHRRGVDRRDERSDDNLEPDLFGCGVGANDAGQAVAIGDRQGRKSVFCGLRDQLFAMRCSFEKREIRRAMQLGVTDSRRDSWR